VRRAGQENLYAGRVVQDENGGWWFMAFRGGTATPVDGEFDDRTFVGELTEPFPVSSGPSGELRIDTSADASTPGGRRAATAALGAHEEQLER